MVSILKVRLPDGTVKPIAVVAAPNLLAPHADSHKPGGDDALTPEDIGAAKVEHTHSIATYVSPNYAAGFDLDAATDDLLLIPIAQSKNCPISDTFLYIRQLFFDKVSADANRIQIAFPYGSADNSGVIALRTLQNGVWSKWRKLVTTDYAVKNSGDTMTGTLQIVTADDPNITLVNKAINTKARIAANDNEVATFSLIDEKTNNYTVLALDKKGTTPRAYFQTSEDGKWGVAHTLLHEGNLDALNIARAPKGSYVGTGEEIEQTHNIGYGNAVIIWTETEDSVHRYTSLVTPAGLIGFQNATGGGNIGAYTPDSASYKNGVLKISSKLVYINGSGATYYYQAI